MNTVRLLYCELVSCELCMNALMFRKVAIGPLFVMKYCTEGNS